MHKEDHNPLNRSPYCGDPGALVSYLYNDGSADELNAIAAHVQACDACTRELAALGDTRDVLSAWSPPPTELGFTLSSSDVGPIPAAPTRRPDRRASSWCREPLRRCRGGGSPSPVWMQAVAATVRVRRRPGRRHLRPRRDARRRQRHAGAAAAVSRQRALRPRDASARRAGAAGAAAPAPAPVQAARPIDDETLMRRVRSPGERKRGAPAPRAGAAHRAGAARHRDSAQGGHGAAAAGHRPDPGHDRRRAVEAARAVQHADEQRVAAWRSAGDAGRAVSCGTREPRPDRRVRDGRRGVAVERRRRRAGAAAARRRRDRADPPAPAHLADGGRARARGGQRRRQPAAAGQARHARRCRCSPARPRCAGSGSTATACSSTSRCPALRLPLAWTLRYVVDGNRLAVRIAALAQLRALGARAAGAGARAPRRRSVPPQMEQRALPMPSAAPAEVDPEWCATPTRPTPAR